MIKTIIGIYLVCISLETSPQNTHRVDKLLLGYNYVVCLSLETSPHITQWLDKLLLGYMWCAFRLKHHLIMHTG